MTVREFLDNVQRDGVCRERLIDAVKKEWGGKGVSSSEPFLTNGVSRAVYAVMAELNALAPTGPNRCTSADCDRPASRVISIEDQGYYPYCEACADVLLRAGEHESFAATSATKRPDA